MTRPGTEANLSKSIPSQDDDSLLFTLSARQYNRVRHIIPLDELIIFTSATEWKLTTENSDALTPTTIALRPQSYVGSGNREPIVSGDAVMFIADLGGHVYDMNYSFETDKYKPRDISIIAPHLFDGYTITDWGYSSVPVSIIWAVRSDGKLIGLTYLSGQKPDVLGWHLHETDGEFESVAVIPESSGEKMLYVVVKRRINGVDRRFIERLHSRVFAEVRDAFHVDSGLSYNNPKTITAATTANPVVVTSAGHGFSNGDVVRITDVGGIGIDTGMTELNGNRYTVASVTTNTFELQTTAATPVNVDGSSYSTYVSGGKARKEITVINGLHHLIGESVSIYADGSVAPPQTVAADGSVTLTQGASIAHIGLPYTSDLQTLPVVAAKADGLGQGQTKSVSKVHIRVDKTRGPSLVGPDVSHLKAYAQRTSEGYGEPTALESDEIEIALDASWTRGGQIIVRQTDPSPLTILSLTLEVEFGTA